jgi:hypothetical protein
MALNAVIVPPTARQRAVDEARALEPSAAHVTSSRTAIALRPALTGRRQAAGRRELGRAFGIASVAMRVQLNATDGELTAAADPIEVATNSGSPGLRSVRAHASSRRR